MNPRISDAMLQQIASDAKVDAKQFIRFVNVFGLSIVTAVNACRDMERSKREIVRLDPRPRRTRARNRREIAAAAYLWLEVRRSMMCANGTSA